MKTYIIIKTSFGDINSNKFEKMLLIAIGIAAAIVAGVTVYISLYYPVAP